MSDADTAGGNITGEWVVYSKPDCSLCDLFLQDLAAVAGEQIAAAVRVVDISASPALQAKYGHRIPVLAIEGEVVCYYRLDADRIRPFLQDGG